MAQKRELNFTSIGTCDFCANTQMELFYTGQGLACVTCREVVVVREPMQKKTAENYQREIQLIRNRLEGHGGH